MTDSILFFVVARVQMLENAVTLKIELDSVRRSK